MKVNQVIELTDYTDRITEQMNKHYKDLNIPEKTIREILYQFQQNLKEEIIRLNNCPARRYQPPANHQ